MPGGANMVDGNAVPCAEQACGHDLHPESTGFEADAVCTSSPRFDPVRAPSVLPAVVALGKVTCHVCFDSIQRLARLSSPLLIHGESGTGKTTVARMIHRASGAKGPLVNVNCATQAHELASVSWLEHVIQSARGGTLLLDEVSELPDESQRRLLAMLLVTEHPTSTATTAGVDNPAVRIIGTTAVSLPALVRDHQIRQELFYRLSALSLQLEPLRDRPEMIARYARDVLDCMAARQGGAARSISPEALVMLSRYQWPGNIRELENVCQGAATFGQTTLITPQDLRLPLRAAETRTATDGHLAGRTLAEIERQAVIETLVACAGNKALTARTLGISEKSIYNKIRRHKIQLNPAR